MAKEHLYDQDTGAAYGTYKSYIQGFVLSIVITTIAFALVGFKVLSPVALCVAVMVLALAQLFVQLVFFLHLSTDSKARWNLISAIFAAIIVFIIVAGTIWIMFDLYDMMM
ncbi:MAG: cytochrome o ubiquinol oxidase subunit IV [Francisella sp.]